MIDSSKALYSRAQDNAPSVLIEEGPCLGTCKGSPCIAVSHEDFVGHVSLEGMTDVEFADRV
jgi:NADH:ubiquinone oxidoreductase subunit E